MPTSLETFTPSAQQRLFWRERVETGEETTQAALFEVSPELTQERIQNALAELSLRHEALRTRLVQAPSGEIAQAIEAQPPNDLLVLRETDGLDLDLDACGSLERCSSHQLPFSATLFHSKKAGRRWLRLCASGAVCDRESLWLIGAELNAIFDGASLPETLQHADYAAWQEETAQGEAASPPPTAGDTARLRLPGELESPAGRAASRTVLRPAPGILRDLTDTQALGFWAAYLARVSGVSEIEISTEARSAEEAEAAQAVGPYALPHRALCAVENGLTFAALHNQAASWQFKRGPARALAGFRSWSVPGPKGKLCLSDYSGGPSGSRVTLEIARTRNGGKLALAFDSSRLPTESARHILDGFIAFAEFGLQNPHAPVASAPLVGREERELLLRKHQGVRVKFCAPARVEQLFEEAAASHPNNAAVICGPEQITYGELNARAEALAQQLRAWGAGPELPVGLATKRSIEMVVGILGILKAGAAYVPLDPGYPANRLQSIIDEARLTTIVMTEGVALPPNQARILNLKRDSVSASPNAAQTPPDKPAGDSPAYVIFTSGSTGKPKGVVIHHSNLILSTLARAHYYPGKVGNYLLVSSFAFDSSVAGIFWALTQGGTLTIPEEGMHQDPDELARLIASKRVTHFLGLPSLYNAVLDRAKDLSSLRVAIVAGEACPPELVRRHEAQAPGAGLYNEYGPTEATVWSTVYRCDKAAHGANVPIGKAIPNWQTFIVTESMQLCPVGAPGELLVGGPGLAHGYLNRPDLTDAKFVPNPFTPDYSARLYKTGDLVRLRTDGNIEFLGRIDHQVKIRGYRIELEEIEAALRAIPGVAECLVMAREDGPGGKQLAAYFICAPGASLAPDEIRASLGRALPDYMVPSAFVQLNEFPLNPNGKIDRNALPAPGKRAAAASSESLTPAQTEIARIFSELLGVQSVGADENFFNIGGNSLLAMQLISRIRDHFRADISLRSLFQDPTVRGLATSVETSKTQGSPSGIKRVPRGSARPESPREIATTA